jgi:Fe2+ or Zn2+ uptake regulation protein
MGKKSSLEILRNVLKKEKLRLTDQRIAIWNQIRNSKKHMDVEEIFSLLKAKKENCF